VYSTRRYTGAGSTVAITEESNQGLTRPRPVAGTRQERTSAYRVILPVIELNRVCGRWAVESLRADRGILTWRGQASRRHGAGRPHGPARFGSYRKPISASVSTAQAACRAPASATVTAVTDLLFGYPIIFWTPRDRCSIAKSSAAHDRLSKKLHSLPPSIGRIIQPRGHSCADPQQSRCAANSVGSLLHADAPPQVTQEGGDDRVSGTDADRHDDISHNGSSGFGGNADSAETADLGRVS
jgi:hypothetical protein